MKLKVGCGKTYPPFDAVQWIHVFAFLILDIMLMACLSTLQGQAVIICLWHLFHAMFLVAVHFTYDGLTCFRCYK